MSDIVPIRQAVTIATCDRCGAEIIEGSEAMSIAVQHERWHGNAKWSTVDVIRAKTALLFCMPCAKYYDFKRVAVARKRNELDLEREKRAEEAMIEGARSDVAKALFLEADEVSVEQIRGWLLEQEYEWILAEENRDRAASALGKECSELSQDEILQWVDANPDLKSPFI